MFTIQPGTQYKTHICRQSEGKKGFVRIRESDNVDGSHSKFVIKFFFDELPKGAVDGCKVMLSGITADFKCGVQRHQYNGMWFEELCFSGCTLEVVKEGDES